jgi:hypothetical protein
VLPPAAPHVHHHPVRVQEGANVQSFSYYVGAPGDSPVTEQVQIGRSTLFYQCLPKPRCRCNAPFVSIALTAQASKSRPCDPVSQKPARRSSVAGPRMATAVEDLGGAFADKMQTSCAAWRGGCSSANSAGAVMRQPSRPVGPASALRQRQKQLCQAKGGMRPHVAMAVSSRYCSCGCRRLRWQQVKVGSRVGTSAISCR